MGKYTTPRLHSEKHHLNALKVTLWTLTNWNNVNVLRRFPVMKYCLKRIPGKMDICELSLTTIIFSGPPRTEWTWSDIWLSENKIFYEHCKILNQSSSQYTRGIWHWIALRKKFKTTCYLTNKKCCFTFGKNKMIPRLQKYFSFNGSTIWNRFAISDYAWLRILGRCVIICICAVWFTHNKMLLYCLYPSFYIDI